MLGDRGGDPRMGELQHQCTTRPEENRRFFNDSPALVFRRHTARQFAEMVIDQFDEMLQQSRKYPLVFAISVHPFIIGQPFRLRAFRDAVRHIVRHRDKLWITTPGEIALYCEGLPKGTIPGS